MPIYIVYTGCMPPKNCYKLKPYSSFYHLKD